jgi:signal transduction histidine kinase
MKMGADRIRQIVLSLRNFSRLDEAEMKVVDIHEGIDNTLLILQHRLKPTATSPGIQLQREYGHLPLVECYPGQLNQVFMNILSNAIDALEEAWLAHTEAGADIQCPLPAITVRTTHEDNAWIQVAIIDNGSGIPKEVHSRLFDPFFTTKPLGKGTGLGLSISYQIIVEKHGGTLQCLSEPGKGTEFQIRIPIHSINASTVPVVAFAAG